MTGKTTTPRLPVPSWGFPGESRPKGKEDRMRTDCYWTVELSRCFNVSHFTLTATLRHLALSFFTGSKTKPEQPGDSESHRTLCVKGFLRARPGL